MDKLREIAVQILDLLEDYLNEKNVDIPNSERDEYSTENGNPSEVAILFGTDYYSLEDSITELLENEFPKINPMTIKGTNDENKCE